MAKTSTFTVDNTGDPEPVTLLTEAWEVEVYENAQAGTTDYDVYAPATTDTPVRRPAGSKTLFKATGNIPFRQGQTVGYIGAVTAGSYVFGQEER